ncbi:MAG: DinB family protein [Anaerolineae bacterium]|nr:DinB family protein [Anaerolineae bacterium]
MSKAETLAQKLSDEGTRTLAFLSNLAPDIWGKRCHGESSDWTVRDVVEHMILSEEGLRSQFRQVSEGGTGAPEGFDIDRFNASRRGKLADLSREQLFERYTFSRSRTADFARSLSDAQLALVGRHPAMGMCALEDMLKMMYLHHTMHVKEIKRVI